MEANEKKKIFISAHPSDRYGLLERVVDTINSTGCAEAVYNQTPCDGGDGLPEGVDTLVVLASLKYFVWANSGYKSEFFSAVRDGVKILPIMIESGPNVTDLINMRLGKLQYIDATENLEFALDTLRAHIMAKPRKDIDDSLPSVFISYRRTDKRYLYELVEAVRSSPDYGKINLWYDEIIEPGESYSKAIMRELCDCDLFILVVTPNIFEKSNYVYKVEYKTAKTLRKRIIAVEAEKTDKQTLRNMYGNLPRLTDIKHRGAIHAIIKEIAQLPKRER